MAILPPGTDLPAAYASGSDEEQAFVQNLAMFLTSYFRVRQEPEVWLLTLVQSLTYAALLLDSCQIHRNSHVAARSVLVLRIQNPAVGALSGLNTLDAIVHDRGRKLKSDTQTCL